MQTARRQILMDCFKVLDLVLLLLSYALATVALVEDTAGIRTLAQFVSMRVKIENFAVFTGIVVAWHIVFVACGLYRSKRLASLASEFGEIAKASSAGALLLFLAGMAFHIRMITPLFALIFWLINLGVTVSFRFSLRSVLHEIRKRGRNLRFMLIAGTNLRAVEFAQSIESRPELGYRILGFVDDEWPGLRVLQRAGYQRVCGFDDFLGYLRRNVVDELVIALPMRSRYAAASEIAAACEEQGIAVRHLSIFNPKRRPSHADDLDYSLTSHYDQAWRGVQVALKRLLDVAVSLTTLMLCLPLLVLTAILIKLTSPGPVFFVQKRLGVNKRRFDMYKFRTMVPDAEKKQAEIEHLNEASGSAFKIKNDPRITPLGRFLRKTSIDELPQLVNVLKGDMSLVGPRPLPNRDYDRFEKDWQRRRFSVRPGITCLWQVNGRSSLQFEEWMELDLEYIDQWSLWLDLRILLKTVPAVFRGSGAV